MFSSSSVDVRCQCTWSSCCWSVNILRIVLLCFLFLLFLVRDATESSSLFVITLSLPLIVDLFLEPIHYAHDNSYLSVEYINWVLWIDLTISINTSSRRKYRKRYIDNFSLLMKKNSHYMREVNKLILGTIYHILPQMLILMRYDYYRRTSW